MPSLLRLYLTFRKPRNFLVLLVAFIATMLALHFAIGLDADWGVTNMILSIEASTAGAVLMMVAEESATWQKEHTEAQSRILAAVLTIVEAQRDVLKDHTELLKAIREHDARALREMENGDGMA